MSGPGLLDRPPFIDEPEAPSEVEQETALRRSDIKGTLRRLVDLGLRDDAVLLASAVGKDFVDTLQARPSASIWMPHALGSVEQLRELPDNWDGYDAPPVSPLALEEATRLLLRLEGLDVPPPHISAIPGGGVQIEWDTATRGLEVEVSGDGNLGYALYDGDVNTDSGSLPSHKTADLARLIDWLMHA
jgi:hypothetical protein